MLILYIFLYVSISLGIYQLNFMQTIKKDYKKESRVRYQNVSKKKRKKSNKKILNVTKISEKQKLFE